MILICSLSPLRMFPQKLAISEPSRMYPCQIFQVVCGISSCTLVGSPHSNHPTFSIWVSTPMLTDWPSFWLVLAWASLCSTPQGMEIWILTKRHRWILWCCTIISGHDSSAAMKPFGCCKRTTARKAPAISTRKCSCQKLATHV